jgi:hypothetical protein
MVAHWACVPSKALSRNDMRETESVSWIQSIIHMKDLQQVDCFSLEQRR